MARHMSLEAMSALLASTEALAHARALRLGTRWYVVRIPGRHGGFEAMDLKSLRNYFFTPADAVCSYKRGRDGSVIRTDYANGKAVRRPS